MRETERRHPDMLQRFVATPYVFKCSFDGHDVSIQSNDLPLALGIRHLLIANKNSRFVSVREWKIIRDDSIFSVSVNELLLKDGPLQTLQKGTGTILTYDQDKDEIFGFVSSEIKPSEVVALLIPALIEASTVRLGPNIAFTKK